MTIEKKKKEFSVFQSNIKNLILVFILYFHVPMCNIKETPNPKVLTLDQC